MNYIDNDSLHPLIVEALKEMENIQGSFKEEELWQIINAQSNQIIKLQAEKDEIIKMAKELIEIARLSNIEVNFEGLLNNEEN